MLRLEPASGGPLEVDLDDLLVAINVVILAESLPARRHDLNENTPLGNFRRAGHAILVGLEVEFDSSCREAGGCR